MYAVYEAFKEGFDFLNKPGNEKIVDALDYVMDQSSDGKEYGFVAYAGKKYTDMKNEANRMNGGGDGYTLTIKNFNKLYDENQLFSDVLYGMHSHTNESYMSYNATPSVYHKDGARVRGDIPHVADTKLSDGLFMINSKGEIFFVNKTLANFSEKIGIYDKDNKENNALRTWYINQVYIGNIKQFKKSGK